MAMTDEHAGYEMIIALCEIAKNLNSEPLAVSDEINNLVKFCCMHRGNLVILCCFQWGNTSLAC